jgi:hypothetical protein
MWYDELLRTISYRCNYLTSRNLFILEIYQLLYNEEIRRILQKLLVHCRAQNSPPLVPVLIQIDPVHIFTPYFSKMHFHSVLQSVSFRFSDCYSVANYLCTLYVSPIWSLFHIKKQCNVPPESVARRSLDCRWTRPWRIADSLVSRILHGHARLPQL